MKKIFTITALVFAANAAFAQDDAASKNVRFGLVIEPSLNWYKSGEKIIEKNGVSPKFGGGLGIEFRLTNVAVIATGLHINMDGGKVKYRNDVSGVPSTSFVGYYYDNENEEIAEFIPAYNYSSENFGQTRYTSFLLNERKYMVTYLTIPLTLKLRTKEIGALTYFGQFGVNSSLRLSAKATDEVQRPSTSSSGWGTPETISKSDIKKDMNLFSEALNIGLGVEWNLAGTTSLVIGANYLLGFTNAVKEKSDYTRKYTTGTFGFPEPPEGTELKQTLKSNSIVLTVGVLF